MEAVCGVNSRAEAARSGECSIWDEDDQFFTESFDEWRSSLAARGIRPYKNAAGEVDYFRIELTLNELGNAFLIVDKFATEDMRQLTVDREP